MRPLPLWPLAFSPLLALPLAHALAPDLLLPTPDLPPPTASAPPAVPPLAASPPAPPSPAPEGMILIPAGSFSMGSTAKKAEPNESPVHEVSVAPFWLDRTEVTVGAYRACVQANRCAPPSPPRSTFCTYPRDNPDLPINCVSFREAEHFCLAHGKRLPAEAEWEFAARGPSPRVYPWGNQEPSCERANSMKGNVSAEGCTPSGPAPVGKYSAGKSPFGLLDMAGNVEEWVADFYDDRLPTSAAGSPPSSAHLLRGGGWASPWRFLRVSARSWGSSMEQGPSVGFRCARGE